MLLIGDGGCPRHMAIEARRRNPETGLGQSLKAIGTTEAGKCIKPLQRARQLKAARESDHLIVLRDGRADHMGKGVTIMRIRQRQPVRGKVGLDQHRPTFLAEISMGCFASSARVSMVEEPGAGKPHAGICAGGTG